MPDRIRLYLDEDVHGGVAIGLRRRGHDVLTTIEAGHSGASDDQQLQFAIVQKRCLFSFNRGDLARLHTELLASGAHHYGIILCRQVRVGTVVRHLAALVGRRAAPDLIDQLVWLRIDS